MELKLQRTALRDTYTIGHLYIGEEYFCDTLEDKVRDYNKDGDLSDEGEAKVYAETAIPYGRYRITMNVQSPKFSKRASYDWCRGYLPRLLNVPHFEGILIHAGNTAKDSGGCILVGENKVKGRVINSMATLHRLHDRLVQAKNKCEEIWIEIV